MFLSQRTYCSQQTINTNMTLNYNTLSFIMISASLSFSLSLSHTHTHTHTHCSSGCSYVKQSYLDLSSSVAVSLFSLKAGEKKPPKLLNQNYSYVSFDVIYHREKEGREEEQFWKTGSLTRKS